MPEFEPDILDREVLDPESAELADEPDVNGLPDLADDDPEKIPPDEGDKGSA